MKLKAVFVGQCPAKPEDEGDPLTLAYNESSGSRLARWMGVTNEQFADNFIRVNLNPHADGEFSSLHWRAAAQNMKGLLEGRRIVCLGRPVAESFGLLPTEYEYFRWFDHPGDFYSSLFCVIPHPSGRNRMYNDQHNVNKATGILQALWLLSQDSSRS